MATATTRMHRRSPCERGLVPGERGMGLAECTLIAHAKHTHVQCLIQMRSFLYNLLNHIHTCICPAFYLISTDWNNIHKSIISNTHTHNEWAKSVFVVVLLNKINDHNQMNKYLSYTYTICAYSPRGVQARLGQNSLTHKYSPARQHSVRMATNGNHVRTAPHQPTYLPHANIHRASRTMFQRPVGTRSYCIRPSAMATCE